MGLESKMVFGVTHLAEGGGLGILMELSRLTTLLVWM